MNIALIIITIAFIIYILNLPKKTNSMEKTDENNYKNLQEKNNFELEKNYDSNSEQRHSINSPYDNNYQSTNASPFPFITKEEY